MLLIAHISVYMPNACVYAYIPSLANLDFRRINSML